MGRAGVSRGRSEAEANPRNSWEPLLDGLIPLQPPKGNHLQGYVLVLFLMTTCVSCR